MIRWLTLVIGLFASAAAPALDRLPKPPMFTAGVVPTEILAHYPLRVITKEGAFVHHGQAEEAVELPNGNTGWVYVVGERRMKHTYSEPSGNKETVTEHHKDYGMATYTLEFGKQGKVIDVIYNERGRHNGLTALGVQLDVNAAKSLGRARVPGD